MPATFTNHTIGRWSGAQKSVCTFLCFWLGWVFIVVHRLSIVAAHGAFSLVVVLRLLIAEASLTSEHGL